MKKFKLPDGITNKFGRQILHVQKASPEILFAAGVVGIVGAGVLACRSTLKLSSVIQVAEERTANIKSFEPGKTYETDDGPIEYTAAMQKKDLVVTKTKLVVDVAKLYMPAFGIAAISICMLTGSHVILNRRNAAVTAAYAAAEKAFNQYRERVREEHGFDADQKFRYGTSTVEETVIKKDGTTKVVKRDRVSDEAPSLYAKFFDELNVNWANNPEYNRTFLQAQQNYFNHKLNSVGHVFLNEVYDALGIERTTMGQVVGWLRDSDGDGYIDFGLFDDKTGTGAVRAFVNGGEGSILLDFNVDGVMYDMLDKLDQR